MDPLTARQLNRAIRAGADAAVLSILSLRHAFATDLLGQKLDTRVSLVLLGQ